MRRFSYIFILGIAGCVGFTPGQTAEFSGVEWQAPEGTKEKIAASFEEARAVSIDPSVLQRDWSLADAIDLALRYNSTTQASWLAARAAEAAYKSSQGSYYPTIDVGGRGTDNRSWQGGQIGTINQKRVGPYASVDWLLYDFGRREAAIEEVRQDLLAANYTHNTTIQQVILQVQKAYFGYVAYKSLAKSQELALKEAKTNNNAAVEQHKAGVATIADVLQSQTAVAQAQLSLDDTQGKIKVMRGVVATAVGLPPTTPLDVSGNLEQMLPVDEVSADVESLLRDAEKNSPILAQARVQFDRASATFDKVKAEGWPTIGAMGSIDWPYEAGGNSEYTYSSMLGISFPLFTGFSHSYDVLRAEAKMKQAQMQLKDSWQGRALSVWSSYTDYKTALERISAADILVKSATETQAVTLGRYKQGVGNILDLLAAQRSLEDARSSLIRAKADWLVALAQLRFDIGILSAESNPELGMAGVSGEKKGQDKQAVEGSSNNGVQR